jgi:predicted LPLAT superfamily acyltransferase
MNLCFVIPNYNHGATLDSLLTKLANYKLPCFMIDDASNAETKKLLADAENKYNWLTIFTLPANLGKGGAVMFGLQKAWGEKFTHALQIDADGQHDCQDIPKFISACQNAPDALIVGDPAYDSSAPKSRLYGRKITRFWACIETLSLNFPDTMCGFRIYPLAQTIALMNKRRLGLRMDFDTDIMVRLYWAGCKMVAIPTNVVYPKSGTSNFHVWKDNLNISLMHAKLCCELLFNAPKLCWRKCFQKSSKPSAWFQIQEVGSLWGLKLMLFTYRFIGRKMAYWLLYPIVSYFYLFIGKARRASKKYFETLNSYSKNTTHGKKSNFKHFLEFSSAALDKLSVWNNDVTMAQIDFPNAEAFRQLGRAKQGAVILTAHLGNIEIARALSRFEPDVKINALVFSQNAVKFNAVLEKVNPQCKLNVIEVSETDIHLAMLLKQKIDDGEFIVIVADRISTTHPERCSTANFLGKPARFPQGPFILAGLMHCPIYFMLCVKDENKFKIIFNLFAESIIIQRKYRQSEFAHYTQKYADLLSDYCEKYPNQWFNFFDFWRTEDRKKVHDRK